ncbi:MAG: glutaminase A [Anaerolineae bacterium]|nr:glutaminase A [Anaerolineae bacterium]
MNINRPQEPEDLEYGYISTGQLPAVDFVNELVNNSYEKYRLNTEGQNSQVYPALANAPDDLFGVCLVSKAGSIFSAGDFEHEFPIMSVSKPFVFALVCQNIGPGRARKLVGVNSTGMPFNSVIAIEDSSDGRTNPMVNSGAIAATSLVPGATYDEKWGAIYEGMCKFAGRELRVNEAVYQSASETNFRNRAIVNLLHSTGKIYCDPNEALDLYTRQCSLDVNARDLAVMGATLAAGGINPITGDRVVRSATCHYTLAVMTTAGLYETSGDWLYDIGLPGKSGIGGGIVAVSPGKGGLGTFAPRLDEAGNSVKGQLATRYLSRRMGLDLFISDSEPRRPKQ